MNLTSYILKRLHFVYFFFSSLPWLLLMVLKKTTQAVWHHLVLSWCTMVSEVKRRFVQESKNIDYAGQHHTPHCWLPDNVMFRLTRFSRSTPNLLMKNVQIYIYIYTAVLCNGINSGQLWRKNNTLLTTCRELKSTWREGNGVNLRSESL